MILNALLLWGIGFALIMPTTQSNSYVDVSSSLESLVNDIDFLEKSEVIISTKNDCTYEKRNQGVYVPLHPTREIRCEVSCPSTYVNWAPGVISLSPVTGQISINASLHCTAPYFYELSTSGRCEYGTLGISSWEECQHVQKNIVLPMLENERNDNIPIDVILSRVSTSDLPTGCLFNNDNLMFNNHTGSLESNGYFPYCKKLKNSVTDNTCGSNTSAVISYNAPSTSIFPVNQICPEITEINNFDEMMPRCSEIGNATSALMLQCGIIPYRRKYNINVRIEFPMELSQTQLENLKDAFNNAMAVLYPQENVTSIVTNTTKQGYNYTVTNLLLADDDTDMESVFFIATYENTSSQIMLELSATNAFDSTVLSRVKIHSCTFHGFSDGTILTITKPISIPIPPSNVTVDTYATLEFLSESAMITFINTNQSNITNVYKNYILTNMPSIENVRAAVLLNTTLNGAIKYKTNKEVPVLFNSAGSVVIDDGLTSRLQKNLPQLQGDLRQFGVNVTFHTIIITANKKLQAHFSLTALEGNITTKIANTCDELRSEWDTVCNGCKTTTGVGIFVSKFDFINLHTSQNCTEVSSLYKGQGCCLANRTDPCAVSLRHPVSVTEYPGQGSLCNVVEGCQAPFACIQHFGDSITWQCDAKCQNTKECPLGYQCTTASACEIVLVGSQCASDSACGNGQYCDSTTNTCEKQKHATAPCEMDSECKSEVCEQCQSTKMCTGVIGIEQMPSTSELYGTGQGGLCTNDCQCDGQMLCRLGNTSQQYGACPRITHAPFLGTCHLPPACPANSHGVDVISGCTCDIGCNGTIVATTTFPYYEGRCDTVDCPAGSSGPHVGAGCVCDAGYQGAITATSIPPHYYSGSCVGDPCHGANLNPPNNGNLGTCDMQTLTHGASCMPTCDNGYTISGKRICHAGVLSSVTCNPIPCTTANNAIANGGTGNCSATLASGETCYPHCNSGAETMQISGEFHAFTLTGKRFCHLGVLTDTAACEPSPCTDTNLILALPLHGVAGGCPSTLLSGENCTVLCDAGYRSIGYIGCMAGNLHRSAQCERITCDASAAPVNGAVGGCTASLASGTTCQPTCDNGYTVSGTSSCSIEGAFTAATCQPNPCSGVSAPSNGGMGTCNSIQAHGSTCQPTCDSGYTASGTSSCNLGTFTAATCLVTLGGSNLDSPTNLQACIGECDADSHCAPGLECFQRPDLTPVTGCGGQGKHNWDYCYNPNYPGPVILPPCDASAPPTNGGVGNCTSTLASGTTCQPTCDNGYTVSGSSSCTAGTRTAGTLTAATCLVTLGGPNEDAPTNLQACIGECDAHSHCAPGLMCFQRPDLTPIKGCGGQGKNDWDYCYNPNYPGPVILPPCDASAPPTNGGVGDCTSTLASGSTCQPTCNVGFEVSGPSSCTVGTRTAGTLTAATCTSLTPQHAEFRWVNPRGDTCASKGLQAIGSSATCQDLTTTGNALSPLEWDSGSSCSGNDCDCLINKNLYTVGFYSTSSTYAFTDPEGTDFQTTPTYTRVCGNENVATSAKLYLMVPMSRRTSPSVSGCPAGYTHVLSNTECGALHVENYFFANGRSGRARGQPYINKPHIGSVDSVCDPSYCFYSVSSSLSFLTYNYYLTNTNYHGRQESDIPSQACINGGYSDYSKVFRICKKN